MGTLSQIVFDSCIVIDALNGIEPARVLLLRERGAAISILTWAEVLAGVRDDEVERATRALLGRMTQVPVTADVAETALQLRRSTKLKLVDACILATARQTGRELLTRNTKDFDASWEGVIIPYRL